MVDPRVTTPPVSPGESARPLARVSWLPWLLFLTTLAVLAWHVLKPEKLGDPLSASMAAFEKQNRLTVFTAQLAPVVASDDSRLLGLVQSKQVAVIPARIDYTLDLGAMNRDRLAWDEATRTLDVQLPPLTVGRPNLDEGRAQYIREGVLITREAQETLNRDNTRLAEQQAMAQAADPVLMNLARSAARDTIRQNLAIPLQVAGFGKVTVNARFDGERPAPPR